MKVDTALISKLENLAKLYLTDLEKKQLQEDLSKMTSMIEGIQEINVDGVEPLRHMSQVTNRVREDIAQPSLDRKIALDNAPKAKDPYFQVPNVLASGKKRASK